MLGGGFTRSYHSHRRRMPEPSIDEVEDRWVRERMYILRQQRRRVAAIVAEIAKVTGPWAHRFGYAPHPQTREIARRLRQQERHKAKAAR
jgi:hypothetical protein